MRKEDSEEQRKTPYPESTDQGSAEKAKGKAEPGCDGRIDPAAAVKITGQAQNQPQNQPVFEHLQKLQGKKGRTLRRLF